MEAGREGAGGTFSYHLVLILLSPAAAFRRMSKDTKSAFDIMP